jgi:segregation and condensation protein A
VNAAAPALFRVDRFHGPLDLLLHLIRTDAIDVTGIAVAELARQYDAHLDALGDADPEAAGESLLMLATVVYMKSRRLLPPDPETAATAENGSPLSRDEPERPALREAAEHLRERETLMELVYGRPVSVVAEFSGEEAVEADLYALLRAFRAILARAAAEGTGRISRERITLVERIHWLMDMLQEKRRVAFHDLFQEGADRLSLILTFLALLEVIRLRLARAYTGHHPEAIEILLAEDAPPAPPVEEEPLHA